MPHKAGDCGSNYENKISLSVMWAFLLLYWIFLFVLTYVKVAFQASVGIHRLYILLNFISLFVKKCWEKSNVSSFLQALVYFFPFPSTLFLCFLFPVGVSWYSTMMKTYWIFQNVIWIIFLKILIYMHCETPRRIFYGDGYWLKYSIGLFNSWLLIIIILLIISIISKPLASRSSHKKEQNLPH